MAPGLISKPEAQALSKLRSQLGKGFGEHRTQIGHVGPSVGCILGKSSRLYSASSSVSFQTPGSQGVIAIN